MLVPIRTNALIHHYPYATFALMGVNCVVYLRQAFGVIAGRDWMLDYEEFAPAQWITSNFIHGDFFHLVGNMLGFWIFGHTVEGKVGALRFLLVFLAIAVPQCALEQVIFTSGGSFGASAVVYGLMAMCFIFAPKNRVTFFYFFVFPRYVGTFDLSMRSTAYLYLA